MNILEILLIIKKIPPFDRMSFEEINAVVSVMKERSYEPEQLIAARGKFPSNILIPYEGSTLEDSNKWIGLKETINEKGFQQDILSGKSGLKAFSIHKSYIYTILYECPEILVWMNEVEETI